MMTHAVLAVLALIKSGLKIPGESAMATEIERNFLLRDARWREAVECSVWLRQGYLSSDAHRSVRLRIAAGQGLSDHQERHGRHPAQRI